MSKCPSTAYISRRMANRSGVLRCPPCSRYSLKMRCTFCWMSAGAIGSAKVAGGKGRSEQGLRQSFHASSLDLAAGSGLSYDVDTRPGPVLTAGVAEVPCTVAVLLREGDLRSWR